MNKVRAGIAGIMIMGLVLALFGGCQETDSSKVGVVSSTSHIAAIVERVGGDRVSVVNIIPAAQCPGHFDVKPGDVQKLADGDLFFFHGWQGETFPDKLIASANNPDLRVVKLAIEGNWLVPAVQLRATDLITEALIEADPEGRAEYEAAASEYKAIVQAVETQVAGRLDQADLGNVRVIGAEMLAGFLAWTGLDLIATYGRDELEQPQVKRELVDTGREAHVTLVIDNLQSGQDDGAVLAQDLNCARIVLTNFPGGFAGTDTWEETINHNIELILGAVGR